MVDRLSPLDAAFLAFERAGTPMHIAALLVFEGEPEVAGRPGATAFLDTVRERLPLLARCRQRLVSVPFGLHHPVWADDPAFDADYHLRRTRLRQPGTYEQLVDLVSRLHALPLDRARPLWEMHLIDGLKDGRVALYIKIHHAMLDGAAGVELGLALLDLDARGTTGPLPEAAAPAPAPPPGRLVTDAARETLGRGRRAVLDGVRALGGPGSLAARLTSTATPGGVQSLARLLRPAPASPFNVSVGRHRRMAMVPVPLDTAKEIKNATGTTVNDVVLAAVAESLSLFLEHRRRREPGLTYRVMVPMSVRGEDDAGVMGNRLAAMFVDLPVGPMSPARRLWYVAQGMGQRKVGRQGDAAKGMLDLAWLAPAPVFGVGARLAAAGQRFFNLVVSNVPTVQFPLYSGGARLLGIYPLLPLAPNMGLIVCVMSYNGVLHFGLVADGDAFPDIDVLARGVETGFERLLGDARRTRRASGAPARSSPSRRRAARRQAGR